MNWSPDKIWESGSNIDCIVSRESSVSVSKFGASILSTIISMQKYEVEVKTPKVFKKKSPITAFTHGFKSGAKDHSHIVEAFIDYYDEKRAASTNVILIDWPELALPYQVL